MDIVFGHLALILAAAFTGAAIYVLIAEQPARLRLDDGALLAQWQPSYKRGFAMQAPLALLGCMCGLAAWYDKGEASFFWGAIVLLLNFPWTLIAIRPTNNKLMRMNPSGPNTGARALVKRWGYLHTMRALLGAAATIAFYIGCTAP